MDASVAGFLSMLLGSRTQAHVFHLQTSSYAMHKALDDFYNKVVELFDDYVEMYQGRYGLVKGYLPPTTYYEGDESVIPYFTTLAQFVDEERASLPQDSDLNNVVDEISGLIRSTMYKLIFLK